MPSKLQRIYWGHSLRDIKFKLKIVYGERQANVIQTFETLCQTVSMAFGDGSSSSNKPKKKKAYVPQTEAQMEAAFNAVFG